MMAAWNLPGTPPRSGRTIWSSGGVPDTLRTTLRDGERHRVPTGVVDQEQLHSGAGLVREDTVLARTDLPGHRSPNRNRASGVGGHRATQFELGRRSGRASMRSSWLVVLDRCQHIRDRRRLARRPRDDARLVVQRAGSAGTASVGTSAQRERTHGKRPLENRTRRPFGSNRNTRSGGSRNQCGCDEHGRQQRAGADEQSGCRQ